MADGLTLSLAIEPAEQAAWARLENALHEEQVRAETIRRLIAAIEEQQLRLTSQLTSVLKIFRDSGAAAHTTAVRLSEHQDAHPRTSEPLPRTRVHCFGSLALNIEGVTVPSWRSGKARSLFQFLVTHRRRPVPRDTLIQALWPDPDALASGTSLKVAAHALRQIIQDTTPAGTTPPLSVIVQESTYQLAAQDVWVDVEEFERCVVLGGQLEAQGSVEDALMLYGRAAALYTGDFLGDCWEEWAVFRREGLKDQYLTILSKLADAALQANDYTRCIQVCRQILEQDECREDTFRMLMLCHARLGQRGRVRRWFEVCVQTLRTELDVEPETETVKLYEWAIGARGVRQPARADWLVQRTRINPSVTGG